VKLHRTPSTLAVAPPERGEHTDEILTSIGYNADEISEMRKKNVI
jgi:crotonobetainyl-CoA:carnitine CoA-transferase CaiB-like acyl-CoA transferase